VGRDDRRRGVDVVIVSKFDWFLMGRRGSYVGVFRFDVVEVDAKEYQVCVSEVHTEYITAVIRIVSYRINKASSLDLKRRRGWSRTEPCTASSTKAYMKPPGIHKRQTG
jgi:hypothetical protein